MDPSQKIIWLSRYNNPVTKRLIERCKFYGFTDLVYPWLHTALSAESTVLIPQGIGQQQPDLPTLTHSPQSWTLVPIPLHWSRRLWRGFNQSDVIANCLQKILPELLIANNLIRNKQTRQQATLSKTDRQKNIAGAFTWSSAQPTPANIILVDDVYTSGATIKEAKKTLLQAGAKDVWCLVLARKFSD